MTNKLWASEAPLILPVDVADPDLEFYLPLWYPHGDIDGNTIYSYDRHRNACTVTGALFGYNGEPGRYFDNSDDKIAIVSPTDIAFQSNEFTILGWIKPSDVVAASILSYKGQTNGLDINIFGNKLRITKIDIAHILSSSSDIPTTSWTFFAAIRNTNNDWYIAFNGSTSADNSTNDNREIDIIGFDSVGWGEYGYYGNMIGEVIVFSVGKTLAFAADYYDATKWRYQ